jgi:hypothetical protein
MISAENNEILIFRQIWADGHELPEKNTNYVFFIKFYSTAMI